MFLGHDTIPPSSSLPEYDYLVGSCPHCRLRCRSHYLSYTLTFMLLASEMAAFCIFVAPLPFKIRRRLFRFLSESPIVAKISYGLKISFMYESSITYLQQR